MVSTALKIAYHDVINAICSQQCQTPKKSNQGQSWCFMSGSAPMVALFKAQICMIFQPCTQIFASGCQTMNAF